MRRQLAERRLADARTARTPGTAGSWAERYGFALITLVLAIPLSAVAGGMAGLSGLVVAWLGIVGVNAAQAVRPNREPRPAASAPRPRSDPPRRPHACRVGSTMIWRRLTCRGRLAA
ncbi:hypothetical protein ACFQ3Z_19735 [Streptomyces nogalater]